MSILLRPGYFFTLMFASALAGAACVPFASPELFGLTFLVATCMFGAGVICACGLILRWPTVRAVTFAYLTVLLVLSAMSAFTQPSPVCVGWLVLGVVYGVLLIVFFRSRMIRSYLVRP